jgi:hypothetical protein
MPSLTVVVSIGVVVGLIVGFGASYAVYAGQISSLETNLNQASESNSMLQAEVHNATVGLALKPVTGQMIHSAWVFLSPLGGGDYAVSLHAEGLESPSSGSYIVEGVTRGTAMNMVPISGNATTSEFEAGQNGVGTYWTTVMQNPNSAYESIDLVYLPGMSMTDATVVASVQLG